MNIGGVGGCCNDSVGGMCVYVHTYHIIWDARALASIAVRRGNEPFPRNLKHSNYATFSSADGRRSVRSSIGFPSLIHRRRSCRYVLPVGLRTYCDATTARAARDPPTTRQPARYLHAASTLYVL